MVFFPMLVNTVEDLQAGNQMLRDLTKTYAASPMTTLMRLPMAMPFIFNGLKIATTLALIRATRP